ncbi:MAG: hypothetical protein B7X90_06400 [Novosphingobium sp. 17-62-19]|uniref:hypothetical protein n=1 Tax=Novosphingobium sp. 17-62-19 TaxID=1970406 RepID=UPI000BD4F4D3|nr:hypothetical protein [Novosphingobium sp. 17-62-19]OZA20267.1 MAG: hypothetical protein B7X90_06400 [Novosphingobium sp. 17-62-19]HQS96611.1 hypothetical protein [Novosphingobium sp.]
MPEAQTPAITVLSGDNRKRRLGRRIAGFALVGTCLGFMGHRVAQLGPGVLLEQASWPLAGAMVAAPVFFALSNRALSSAWHALADPSDTVAPANMRAIYGRGVLAKYLPGSVFQYASRQIEGAAAGLDHRTLAKSSLVEIALHLPSSLGAMGLALAFARWPLLGILAVPAVVRLARSPATPLMRAGALQLCGFLCFAAAAAVIGAALLPASAPLGLFAGLFLLAWLAGFLVPIAPGGLGVREAVMVALASSAFSTAPVLAGVLALRISSIVGDFVFSLFATLGRHRRPRGSVNIL